jgi:hypothetical protein
VRGNYGARGTIPRVLPPVIVVPSRPAMSQRHPGKTNHVAGFWVAALGAACDPNGDADAGVIHASARPSERPKIEGPSRSFGSPGRRCPEREDEILSKTSVMGYWQRLAFEMEIWIGFD